jgi:regulation of enolase protein 1 (concanavalin A-like superfamily)
MNGLGSDIWGLTDQFRFVYKQLTGNGSIIARVDQLDNTDVWAKAGVMIRATLDSDSALVDGIITPDGRVGMQWRTGRAVDMADPDGSNHSVTDTVTLPTWVKLTRNGNTFSVQYSSDGQTWMDIVPETAGDPASIEVTMPQTVYVGLAVCSHNDSQTTSALFSEIATTGTISGQWQSAPIGADQVAGNGIDALYIAVEDSAGHKATLVNPDPYAVSAGAWTQWTIPLSDLTAAGVNTQRISKFYVGVGDRNGPSQNASGLMYIDDIAYGHPAP